MYQQDCISTVLDNITKLAIIAWWILDVEMHIFHNEMHNFHNVEQGVSMVSNPNCKKELTT